MSTFAKTPRFQRSSKTLRSQARFGPQKATSDRNLRNKGEARLREIAVDNPAIYVQEGNGAGAEGTLQSEECNIGEGKETSPFGAEDVLKGIRGAENELMNQILEERFSLLEGLLENLRKEMDVRRYAQ